MTARTSPLGTVMQAAPVKSPIKATAGETA